MCTSAGARSARCPVPRSRSIPGPSELFDEDALGPGHADAGDAGSGTAARDRYTTARNGTGRFGDVAGRWVFWDFDGTLAARDRTWSGTLLDALATVDPDHGLTVETLRPQLASRLPWHDAATSHTHLNDADDWWAAMRQLFVGAYLRAGVAEGPARRAAGRFRDHYLDPAHWSVVPARAIRPRTK